MFERRRSIWIMGTLGALIALGPFCFAAAKRTHSVALGGAKKVSYSKAGDPAGALPSEDSLKIRPLVVDGAVKEWTTGDAHEVTDRSFVVRRAIRLNDDLPGEKSAGDAARAHWVWQRGPWLLVDRISGHVIALKLPDYDPGVSLVSWFRDYAAYCGVTASNKSLYAVVAQLAVRRPVLAKKLEKFDPEARVQTEPVCGPPQWERDPLRVMFYPAGHEPAGFEIVPGSAMLIEDNEDPAEAPGSSPNAQP